MKEQGGPRRPGSVLFLIGSMREGGAEGQVVHLMRGLRQREWRVAVMLLRAQGVRLEELRREGFEVFDVALPLFRPRWSPLPWLGLWRSWRRSRVFLRAWKPDVLHAWLYWAHLWGRMIVPRDIPLITSRRQTGSDAGKILAMERWINRRTALIISNSRRVEQVARRQERWPAGQRHLVIPNGLDLEAFDAAPAADLRASFPDLADADSVAIYVANLLRHKGHETLLRAWAGVVEHHPRAKVLCVGSADDAGHLRHLERLRRDLGLDRHVVFAGLRTDVPSLVKAADLAVHASDDEGFSNAVLEYMAGGLAIVATRVGGTAEAIGRGRCGVLVGPGNWEELAAAVVDILQDGHRRSSLAVAARKRLEIRYSLRKMVEEHVRAYQGLGASKS